MYQNDVTCLKKSKLFNKYVIICCKYVIYALKIPIRQKDNK